jgi:hypothetical protein
VWLSKEFNLGGWQGEVRAHLSIIRKSFDCFQWLSAPKPVKPVTNNRKPKVAAIKTSVKAVLYIFKVVSTRTAAYTWNKMMAVRSVPSAKSFISALVLMTSEYAAPKI